MKADILRDCELYLYAENNIELYALKKWWNNYLNGNGESKLFVSAEFYKDIKNDSR